MSDLAYAGDIEAMSSSYRLMQNLLEAVKHHDAAVGMRINASEAKAKSVSISGEQRQAILIVNAWRMLTKSSASA